MVSALAFWIAAAGIQFNHIVERRENDAVQRVCCKLAWWKLGSPDEFVSFFILGRIQVCESPIGQKLCMIKDLQIFHKLKQFVALVNP